MYIAHAGKGLILLGIGNFNHGATKACGLNQVCILYCILYYTVCDICHDAIYYGMLYGEHTVHSLT